MSTTNNQSNSSALTVISANTEGLSAVKLPCYQICARNSIVTVCVSQKHTEVHGHTTLRAAHYKLPHSVLTRDVNAHSTLWHSYSDDHRGQLISDVISNPDHIRLNPDHIRLNPDTPTRVSNTSYHHGVQHTTQPNIMDNSTRTII